MTRKAKQSAAAPAPPVRSPQPQPQNDQERVMVLVGAATAGCSAPDIVQLAREYSIDAGLVRRTAEGLEDSARVLREALRSLGSDDDDSSDEDD